MLSESYWPATNEIALLDTTCGAALRAVADAAPTRYALIEGHPEPARRRRWTYAELHHTATRTAHALLAHF